MWTGAIPPRLEARLDRTLPRGTRVRDLLERSDAREAILAALAIGTVRALVAAALSGAMPARRSRVAFRAGWLARTASVSNVWLQQAGVGLGAGRVLGRERVRRSVCRLADCGAHGFDLRRDRSRRRRRRCCQRAYFGRRRRSRLREVQAAWPDGLRDMSRRSRPGCRSRKPSRTSPRRARRRCGSPSPDSRSLARVLGTGPALELFKEDLADATSDRVLEVLILAQERGGIDRARDPRGSRRRDDAGSQAARRARDRRPGDADQRQGGGRAAVARAHRADRSPGCLPRLLPVGRAAW